MARRLRAKAPWAPRTPPGALARTRTAPPRLRRYRARVSIPPFRVRFPEKTSSREGYRLSRAQSFRSFFPGTRTTTRWRWHTVPFGVPPLRFANPPVSGVRTRPGPQPRPTERTRTRRTSRHATTSTHDCDRARFSLPPRLRKRAEFEGVGKILKASLSRQVFCRAWLNFSFYYTS